MTEHPLGGAALEDIGAELERRPKAFGPLAHDQRKVVLRDSRIYSLDPDGDPCETRLVGRRRLERERSLEQRRSRQVSVGCEVID